MNHEQINQPTNMEDLIKSHESRIQALEGRIASAQASHAGITTSANWVRGILVFLFAGMTATVLWNNVREWLHPPAARIIQSDTIMVKSQENDRSKRVIPVVFSTPFSSAPQVIVSVPHFQGAFPSASAIWIEAKASEISSRGFNLTFHGDQARIDAATIQWIAYGN